MGTIEFARLYSNDEPILGFDGKKFEIDDGTHRLCVCKQRNLKFPLEVSLKESDLVYFNKKDILEIIT